mmetsp:Transcript_101410/g.286078  ORF Transcript_101410/g.286078 Transcript_101410/m.286078 type:complete len:219 (+) Transcript_101410:472-1128(+)
MCLGGPSGSSNELPWPKAPLRLFWSCWLGDRVPLPKTPRSSTVLRFGGRRSRPRRAPLSPRPRAGTPRAVAHVPPTTWGTPGWSQPALLLGLPTLEHAPPSARLRDDGEMIWWSSSRLLSKFVAFGGRPWRDGGRGPQLSTGMGCRVFFCSKASTTRAGPERAPRPAAADADGPFFLLCGRLSSSCGKPGTSAKLGQLTTSSEFVDPSAVGTSSSQGT